MSDDSRFSETSEQQPHHPKHRMDDVPVDGESAPGTVPASDEPDLSEFGENPDTELAG